MATISALNTKLTLNTSGFRTNMQKARKQVADFTRGVVRGGAKVAAYGGAVAAAAVGGIALITKQHLSAIDASAKFADSIGIQTEQLAGLRYAASITGVEQDKFDKSLQKMVRGVGEASQGIGTAKEGLEQLGIPIDELIQMSPDEQFRRIAQEISGMENSTAKAAVAAQIFGRNGVDLINTLNMGADGISGLQARAEELGLTFSRVDAAKVEAANDALTDVGALITGIGQKITVALAPYITAAATQLVEMAGSGESMGSRVATAVEWVTKGLAYAADLVELPKAGFYGLRAVATAQLALVAKAVDTLLIQPVVKAINLLPGIEAEFEAVGQFGDEAFQAAADSLKKADEAMSNFLEGRNSAAVQEFFQGIQDKAATAAEEIAATAEANAGVALPVEIDDGSLQNALDQITMDLDQFGMDPIEMKLLDLKELGAGADQLERARGQLEKIAALERSAERTQNIENILEGLESEVRMFGLTMKQKQMLELESLGATDEQLARASAAFDALEQKRRQTDLAGQDRSFGLTRANSAEAQAAAYSAGRGGDRQLEETKTQTQLQTRMADALESLDRKGTTTTIEFEEVDIA